MSEEILVATNEVDENEIEEFERNGINFKRDIAIPVPLGKYKISQLVKEELKKTINGDETALNDIGVIQAIKNVLGKYDFLLDSNDVDIFTYMEVENTRIDYNKTKIRTEQIEKGKISAEEGQIVNCILFSIDVDALVRENSDIIEKTLRD